MKPQVHVYGIGVYEDNIGMTTIDRQALRSPSQRCPDGPNKVIYMTPNILFYWRKCVGHPSVLVVVAITF